MEGWILLHRKIQESKIWTAANQPFDMRSAWVDLLLLANHDDVETLFDYKPMIIKRGQYLTSVRKLSARWSWSKDRTLKFLRLLETERMIHRDSNNQRTLVTIENYDVYQCKQDTNKDTTSYTGTDTGSPQTNNEKNVNNNNIRFVPPTLDEVRAYCLERKNNVDPESFVSFYESKGWMIGKNKMKDWKAAVRTWEKKEKEMPVTKKSKFDNFGQRKYDFGELERLANGN